MGDVAVAAKVKTARRTKKTESEALRAAADKRRIRVPLILKGIEPGKRQTIQVAQFGQVDVDRRYQRDRISDEINDLIYVLQHGGKVLDPITVVRRRFAENGVVSNKLWIIDGQQRFMAHMEVGEPIDAIVHTADSLEAEKAFFLVMNTRKTVSANLTVNSWPGRAGELIRRVADNSGHSLHGRVALRVNGQALIGAAILVRGVYAALGAGDGTGDTKSLLYKIDLELAKPQQMLQAEAFLSLVGRVFPRGYTPVLAVMALGCIANERWAKHIETPPPSVIARLSRVDWKNEVHSYSSKFLPVMKETVRRNWR